MEMLQLDQTHGNGNLPFRQEVAQQALDDSGPSRASLEFLQCIRSILVLSCTELVWAMNITACGNDYSTEARRRYTWQGLTDVVGATFGISLSVAPAR